MTVPLIEVETLDLVEASRMLRLWVAEPLEVATRGLWITLAGATGMAGGDPGGASWASSYDRAAAAALNAAGDAINGVNKLSAMLAQSARNYEAADVASTPAVRRVMESSVATLPCIPTFMLSSCLPPSAVGGSGGGPTGWGLIEDVVGCVWPNGHQDQLHAAAAAWRRSADALAHGADDVVSASQRAIADRLPEADDIWTVCSGTAAHLRQLESVHASLADACTELAHHIDQVHSEVIGELRSLVEWSAGIQAAGGCLSAVTFGIAEVPAQAAQAARVARTAAVVGAMIEKFVVAVRGLAQALAAVAERAEAVGGRLRVILGARLAEPALAGVGPMRVLNEAREVGAVGRLGSQAVPGVRLFADKQAARGGLPGNLASVSNKFFKAATGKSRDFKITEESGGAFRMEFFSPANNAGYGKLYVQVVDSQGHITQWFKDTIGPTGSIGRKWLRGGP